MAPYLMDHMLERLRRHHAAAMRAYAAPIPLPLAAALLCFDTKKEVGLLCNIKTHGLQRCMPMLVSAHEAVPVLAQQLLSDSGV